jgi:uncharacterized membrane protein YsdA (DUF1294 family)/cold shock CspA family protein
MAKQAAEALPSTEQKGVVVKFDADKGFGFIRPKNGNGKADPDVFVHIRNVDGRRNLVPGQSVSYYLTRTDKGVAAIKVKPGSVLNTPYLKFAIIGFGGALLILVIMLALTVALNTTLPLPVWLVLWILALSVASFGIYGYDKSQAQSGGTRVPELILHLLSALGGSPGSFMAMRLFHHKTIKTNFQIVFWIIVAVQVVLLAYLLFIR